MRHGRILPRPGRARQLEWTGLGRPKYAWLLGATPSRGPAGECRTRSTVVFGGAGPAIHDGERTEDDPRSAVGDRTCRAHQRPDCWLPHLQRDEAGVKQTVSTLRVADRCRGSARDRQLLPARARGGPHSPRQAPDGQDPEVLDRDRLRRGLRIAPALQRPVPPPHRHAAVGVAREAGPALTWSSRPGELSLKTSGPGRQGGVERQSMDPPGHWPGPARARSLL